MSDGDRATTAIGRPLPLVLAFVRERPGRYVSSTDGPGPIRWTITRLHGCNWWEVERIHRDGAGWIVFDSHMARSVTAGMQWCEDAARNDGLLRPLTTACRPTHRARTAVGLDLSHLPGTEG